MKQSIIIHFSSFEMFENHLMRVISTCSFDELLIVFLHSFSKCLVICNFDMLWYGTLICIL